MDWDRFRQSRPSQADPAAIYFVSPRLQRIAPAAGQKNLEAAHLSRRATNALNKLGIRTLAQLIKRARAGLTNLRNIGALTRVEITDALDALSRAADDTGAVSWVRYCQYRGFEILPRRKQASWDAAQFVRDLPTVLERAIDSRLGDKAAVVFREHTLRGAGATRTLAEISRRWGETEQAGSLLERNIISLLRRVLCDSEYPGCRFHIREEFLQPFHVLRASAEAWKGRVMTHANWESLLDAAWGLSRTDVRPIEGLLLTLSGVRLFIEPKASADLRPNLPTKTMSRSSRRALGLIKRALRLHYPNGLDSQQLQDLLRSEGDYTAGSLPDLSALIAAVDGVERVPETGVFRMKLHCLPRVADQCERLLRAAREPKHHRSLEAAIVEATQRTFLPRSVLGTLSHDRRFVSVGRSGLWALAEWKNIETRSAITIAADILQKSERPVKGKALIALVSRERARPVKVSSLRSQMAADPRFQRLDDDEWTTSEKHQ